MMAQRKKASRAHKRSSKKTPATSTTTSTPAPASSQETAPTAQQPSGLTVTRVNRDGARTNDAGQ